MCKYASSIDTNKVCHLLKYFFQDGPGVTGEIKYSTSTTVCFAIEHLKNEPSTASKEEFIKKLFVIL